MRIKVFIIFYHSKNSESDRQFEIIRATSKEEAKEKWFNMMDSDEYVFEKIVQERRYDEYR